MITPQISLKNIASAAIPSKKTVVMAATTTIAAGAGYLAYTGKLAPLAIATAEKISTFVAAAYALGCEACILAAPYYNQMKVAINGRYAIPALTPVTSALSAKVAPIAAMVGMTPVTLSIALGTTVAFVVVVILAKKLHSNKNLLAQNQASYKNLKTEHERLKEDHKILKQIYRENCPKKTGKGKEIKTDEHHVNLEELLKELDSYVTTKNLNDSLEIRVEDGKISTRIKRK